VQTFVVRPDGTVVATEPGTAEDPVPAQQEQLAAQTEQIEPVPVATVAIGDPAASASAPADAPATSEPPVAAAEPAPIAAPASSEEAQIAAVGPAPVAVAPEPQAAASAAVPAPGEAAGGGYVVQVSSQRSQDQAEAAFADLQQRYGSVLGGLNSSIQRADLGEKGVYYRVRVGPWTSREEAVSVCEALQGAGGTCFVTQ
jgi:cell division protein FtsN